MSLEDLGIILSNQFGTSNNAPSTLDHFAAHDSRFFTVARALENIDRSAERSYIEDGFIRNIAPRFRQVTWQQPNMTIVVKKRMFSSLADTYASHLMNQDERLFIRASKRIFNNKCRAIAAYERLTKLQDVARDAGEINSHLLPLLTTMVSQLESVGVKPWAPDQGGKVYDRLRTIFAFSEPAPLTSWNIDPGSSFFDGDIGPGTGTFDLTVVSGAQTTVRNKFGGGSAGLTIEDPYQLMLIRPADINRALTEESAEFLDPAEPIKARLLQQMSDLSETRVARGLPPIEFRTSPGSLLSRKVRVFIGNDSRELPYEYFPGLFPVVNLDDVAQFGDAAPRGGEIQSIQSIIQGFFLLFEAQKSFSNQVRQNNVENNYVRRKLTLHYANKLIIQPMDVINYFIKTDTQADDNLTKGLVSQNVGQKSLSQFNELSRVARTDLGAGGAEASRLMNTTGGSFLELEKAAVVGADFPTWLWRAFRNDFTKQAGGVCVFVGVVETATRTYGDGKNTVTVQAADNASYFSRSFVNFKPSLEVYDGALFDPLTVFDVAFDAATGDSLLGASTVAKPPYLPENQELILQGVLQVQAGPTKGAPLTQGMMNATNKEFGVRGITDVVPSAPGFVYRWKEGIGAIAGQTQAQPQNPDLQNVKIGQRLTQNPFAGQDVMNVISLLVTGQPYSYVNFLKSALDNGGLLSVNEQTSQQDIRGQTEQVTGFLLGLAGQIQKNNLVWGGFVPFKKLVVDEGAQEFLKLYTPIVTQTWGLDEQLKAQAKFLDDLYSAVDTARAVSQGEDRNVANRSATLDEGITEVTQTINEQVQGLQSNLQNLLQDPQQVNPETRPTLDSAKARLNIIGNDVFLDPSISPAQMAATEHARTQERRELKKRMGFLTLRRLWAVRANQDSNLFVVDDQYDTNLNIQGFERALSGQMEKFASEYQDVSGQITSAAMVLGLEVFADSQGHIQARPPLYNRMPTSLFYKMIRDARTTGKRPFPQFLESLFLNNAKNLMQNLQVCEDEIRLWAVVGGLYTQLNVLGDFTLALILNGQTPESAPRTPEGQTGPGGFAFVTNPLTGGFDSQTLQGIMGQSNPESGSQENDKSIADLRESLTAQARLNRVFTVFDRIAPFTTYLSTKRSTGMGGPTEDFSTGADVPLTAQTLISRLVAMTGTAPLSFQQAIENKGTLTDRVNALYRMGQLVAERQKFVRAAADALGNIEEIETFSQVNPTQVAFPSLTGKPAPDQVAIPNVISYMLEDEEDDAIGPGSGLRFIIRDRSIISQTLTEKAPPYTSVKVNSSYDAGERGQVGGFIKAPAGFEASGGGNILTMADAVDYDLWRMYGFTTDSPVHAPFFRDASTQGRPYAVYLLNLARKQVFAGTVTVAGNEYYQVGDVVYLETEDMLFYVEEVNHQFGFGNNSFSTTLTLTFGRSPGEYLPTMLDVIGGMLFTSVGSDRMRNARFANPSSDSAISAVIDGSQLNAPPVGPEDEVTERNPLPLPTAAANAEILTQMVSGPVGTANTMALRTALTYGATQVAKGGNENGFKTKRQMEVRYYKSVCAPYTNRSISQTAHAVADWLVNPSIEAPAMGAGLGEATASVVGGAVASAVAEQQATAGTTALGPADTKQVKLPRDLVKVVPVNLDNEEDPRPSASAWNAARLFITHRTPSRRPGGSADLGPATNTALLESLVNNVVDIWITEVRVEETVQDEPGNTEKAQADRAQTKEAKKGLAGQPGVCEESEAAAAAEAAAARSAALADAEDQDA